MTTLKDNSPTTKNVHSDRHLGAEHGGIHTPIHTSVQFGFDQVEDLIAIFQGSKKNGFNYARQGTPTTAALEAKITQLEHGLGTVCFASGMAAIAGTFFALLRAGDHIISSRYVFGNTNSLLDTLSGLGIEVSKIDTGSVSVVEASLRPNTRMVFVETIANPGTQVPDLMAIGNLCSELGLVYVIDNTITSPALFQPHTVAASLVINSLTKTIAGHGTALGGAVTDTGLFDWQGYPNIFKSYRKGNPRQWALQQIRKKALRDMGGTLSPEQAHSISVGAETLELRTQQTSSTAMALAKWLQTHPRVRAVHYPGLESHPNHARAAQLFKSPSWLLSFELSEPTTMLQFLNRLKLPIKATGMGDTRTLIIPVAPTIFWEAGAEVRAEMGIADGLIRLSVGLEDSANLIQDFSQALE
ncbi:cystathionine gamma-synthase family protein [Pseudomonas syringae pv. syringae]|uniref:cystathionine gamma-synthase family protein n=1 Tax=Pseudomonas TaxID=286 RepID=UPI001CE2EACD|nr:MULTISPECIES: cystathionine gamma-synthase family protein [Pseudomonas]MCA5967997.1 cystathionine gamma-synthase family protein [Pseudomonas sp. P129]MEE1991751.1 cystathionine gamma-synthase family protein [Pseudomonas syringae pv. syringae]MEE1996806.1 cystathionine gamma-synthase family protein [Pseudomonas syringae pv. syringae]